MSKRTEKIKAFVEKHELARLGGGQKVIDKQHERGKYTARERIEMLVDKGSSEEHDMFKLHRCHNFGMEEKQYLGGGVVVGSATIDGRFAYLYAQDFTVNGGSLSETMAQKICKVMDMAMTNGAPVVCMNDSGGARIQEDIPALVGYGEIFKRNILASGVILQISSTLGLCAGGTVYSPALTDFTIMREQTSYTLLTGPKVVKTVAGGDIDAEHLGGANVHVSKSGVTSFTAKIEEETIDPIKKLLSYIPSNNREEAPRVRCTDPINRKEDLLNEIIPDDPNQVYNIYKVIRAVTDNGELFEVQPKFAKNTTTGFARFNGQSVGTVANQPPTYAGASDTSASRKGACFVRFCDAFNIPIISLVDVLGFLPGTGQEYNAVILHGTRLFYAYGEATVPKITITLRKSYGGPHTVTGCEQPRSDLDFAWPSAEIAVMGASGAAAVLRGRGAREVKEQGGDVKQFLAEKEGEYLEKFANPYQAVQFGHTDGVIEPRNIRFRICRGLAQLAHKKQDLSAKKHGYMSM